jgi:hypothetical protein
MENDRPEERANYSLEKRELDLKGDLSLALH